MPGGAIYELELTCEAIGECLVTSATVGEAISRPTRATVHVLTTGDIPFEAPIGVEATLSLSVDGEAVRSFHLVVAALGYDGLRKDGKRRWVVDLVHELALLEYRSDVRMFQEMDTREIVAKVLDGAGVPPEHVAWSVQRRLAKRTYCVEYRETDLAFVSRLLEHEGIFYVCSDVDGASRTTFADHQGAFEPIGAGSLSLVEHGDGVRAFELEAIATIGRATLGDYNFEAPNVDLTASVPAGDAPRGDRYEYAAGYSTPDEGQALARIRCEELVEKSRIGRGRSDRPELRAGGTFDLEGPLAAHLAQKYVVTEVDHEIVTRGEDADHEQAYENRFSCIPHAIAYRPPRTTPRPRIAGVHSAVVTGPGGEIHTDEHGRMKGHFFWDRVAKTDDTSSCWMRVIQLPIGGSMAVARMGWEMSVFYFDGDPDRPIAFERLYNAEKPAPYGFPAAKTRMSLQTPSSPANGKANEIRMEDGGGGMEMFVNASKDHDSVTNADKTEKVGVNATITVGVDAERTVGAAQTVAIGGNEAVSVGSDAGAQVSGDRTVTIGGSETVSVGGNVAAVVAGADTEATAGSHMTLAGLGVDKTSTGSYTLTVGGSMVSAAALGVSMAIAGAKSLTVGGAKVVASGKAVTESVVGALASTVGGVCVHAAAANRMGSTKGVCALTVGGLISATAGGKLSIKAKKITIRVAGVANFLGGGGVLTLTPGSASLAPLVKVDASGSVKISGNPNIVG